MESFEEEPSHISMANNFIKTQLLICHVNSNLSLKIPNQTPKINQLWKEYYEKVKENCSTVTTKKTAGAAHWPILKKIIFHLGM